MDRPASAQRRNALVTGLALLIAGWLAAFCFTLWRLHSETLTNAQAAAAMHARNFAEHLTQTFQIISLTADGIDISYGSRDSWHGLGRRMANTLRPAPYLRSLSLADSSGRIIASSNPANLGANVQLATFYPELAPGSTQLRIGRPWAGRDLNDGRPAGVNSPLTAETPSFIPVASRVTGLRDNFWLIAALNPDYFIDHFVQLLPQESGHVQLLRYDGLLLLSSKASDQPGQYGQAGLVSTLLADNEAGELTQTLPDGTGTITAYRSSNRFPLLIAVHLDRKMVLENWLGEAESLTLIVIPILAALTAALVLLWRREQRIIAQQAELARERRLAASVFDASSNAIILTAPDGRILSTNPAFEQISGYSSQEACGRNPRLLSSHLQDQAFYRKLWGHLLETGHWHGEIVNRRKDGSLYTGLLTINAVRDEQEQLTHYVGVTSDMTERKRYEAALFAAKESAETASLAKSTFLATMSHELRTPMNGILGMSELLLRTELSDKQRRQLAIIHTSATALLGIISEILDYSRIESGDIHLAEITFSPAELLRELVAEHSPQAETKGLKMQSVTTDGLPPQIIGDLPHLRDILERLLANAVKFTQTGEISVAASASAPNPGTSLLKFEVSDTGIGIAEDKQTLIFEAFTQADGSFTRSFGGTGLGLAICRKLAAAMGGSLSVESVPGKGSLFRLEVCMQAVPAEAGMP